ncbi:DUF429 domain-containing protein [Halobellus marinus]|uniref:DUF429 domain-containing protein n=1 Tax=Halobellus TaxID=1073986 RepID=UPI0028B0C43D|nr:DUF429 domain-containing protein [Halobellus sp. DFY28]
MTDDTPLVGVDACPAGWVATVCEGDIVRVETHEAFAAVTETYPEGPILVDIPIGLPTGSRRRCDEAASELLGCRGISVFYPPSERAIEHDEYDAASDAHRADVGHGLSQQAFHIRDKIREVADVVGDDYDGRVREAHPELCFAGLNGQPVAYGKSGARGRRLRRALLAEVLDGAERAYEDALERYPRNAVRRDDILDSLVLSVAGEGFSTATGIADTLATVPTDPDGDEPRIYYPGFEIPGPPGRPENV